MFTVEQTSTTLTEASATIAQQTITDESATMATTIKLTGSSSSLTKTIPTYPVQTPTTDVTSRSYVSTAITSESITITSSSELINTVSGVTPTYEGTTKAPSLLNTVKLEPASIATTEEPSLNSTVVTHSSNAATEVASQSNPISTTEESIAEQLTRIQTLSPETISSSASSLTSTSLLVSTATSLELPLLAEETVSVPEAAGSSITSWTTTDKMDKTTYNSLFSNVTTYAYETKAETERFNITELTVSTVIAASANAEQQKRNVNTEAVLATTIPLGIVAVAVTSTACVMCGVWRKKRVCYEHYTTLYITDLKQCLKTVSRNFYKYKCSSNSDDHVSAAVKSKRR